MAYFKLAAMVWLGAGTVYAAQPQQAGLNAIDQQLQEQAEQLGVHLARQGNRLVYEGHEHTPAELQKAWFETHGIKSSDEDGNFYGNGGVDPFKSMIVADIKRQNLYDFLSKYHGATAIVNSEGHELGDEHECNNESYLISIQQDISSNYLQQMHEWQQRSARRQEEQNAMALFLLRLANEGLLCRLEGLGSGIAPTLSSGDGSTSCLACEAKSTLLRAPAILAGS